MKRFKLNEDIKNLKDNIKNNQNKFGKNFPWKSWLPSNVEKIENDTEMKYCCKEIGRAHV